MKKCVIIGSGFAGLSAACFMARDGWKVTVLEKHDMPGGRARKFNSAGFTFDMGPSWYWMPDVFENFFNSFGKSVSDYYELKRLDPSYRVYWKSGPLDIPAGIAELKELFEEIEPGSGAKLDVFLAEAAYKYEVGINKLVRKPGRSWNEFIDADLAKGLLRLDVFTSMRKHVRRFFKDPRIIQLMEFPVLFLGALPADIPALYSLMNYADIKLGTWYPQGGIYEVVNAMHNLAGELGVEFRFNTDVDSIVLENDKAIGVTTNGEGFFDADVVIGAADYHFIESKLLPHEYRSYSSGYWESRVMAPSCLLYYVGIDKKIPGLRHHTLFFDTDFDKHGREIYTEPTWPTDPLFYVCSPSVTDPSVAPANCENLFFLVPVAAGLNDIDDKREAYFLQILERFEKRYNVSIKDSILVKHNYGISDFVNDYNAFKGNAYGLANTLMQTAILKPGLKSRKVKNLYYTGQLTVPGPGVPPSLISGEIVAKEIGKAFKIQLIKKAEI